MQQPINYDVIAQIIPENSRVLDLGCGDGILLKKLIDEKNATGVGVEINQEAAIEAIEKNLSIIQGDIDEGLKQFLDNSFDYIILNQTLQSTEKPDYVIDEMLRVGKKTLVSFPNFAYWKVRLYLLLKGKMPKSKALPYEWFNTPNIHLLTICDFFDFCATRKIKILQTFYLSPNAKKPKKNPILHLGRWIANLFSQEVVFVIER